MSNRFIPPLNMGIGDKPSLPDLKVFIKTFLMSVSRADFFAN
jgi:hypothetical protein